MKKVQALFFSVLLGMMLFLPTVHAQDTKVQLHDTITLDAFVTEYNRLSEQPIADYSNHSTRGDYEAYVAVIDQANAMLIHVNPSGLISNILFMHRGEMAEAGRKALLSMFVCSNVALGYAAGEDGISTLTEAFDQLDIASPNITASRLKRPEIERDYTFLKTENTEKGVHMILMEAVVE